MRWVSMTPLVGKPQIAQLQKMAWNTGLRRISPRFPVTLAPRSWASAATDWTARGPTGPRNISHAIGTECQQPEGATPLPNLHQQGKERHQEKLSGGGPRRSDAGGKTAMPIEALCDRGRKKLLRDGPEADRCHPREAQGQKPCTYARLCLDDHDDAQADGCKAADQQRLGTVTINQMTRERSNRGHHQQGDRGEAGDGAARPAELGLPR